MENEIGSRIKKIRQTKRLTIHDLSERVGLPWGTIARCEMGMSEPSIDRLRKIAVALDVSLADLLSDKEIAPVKNGWLRNANLNSVATIIRIIYRICMELWVKNLLSKG